jgi:hypothetical protein
MEEVGAGFVDINKINDLLLKEELHQLTAVEALEYATTILASAFYNLKMTSTEEILYMCLETNGSIKEKVNILERQVFRGFQP